jgi:N-acetylglucosamine kinase-like BadF-type ATPase
MSYYLGVDVGSSKTHALIADEWGQSIGFGKSQGGNHQDVGYTGLEDALQGAFRQALQMANIQPGQIEGAGFGVGGYDFPSDRADHLKAISALGLSCPTEIVNDGVLGLLAGATGGIGVNISAGSSVNCRGRGRDGREGRIVGNGIEFGEHGGAIEIVQRGLQMVNYAWIKRIPPTLLTQIYLEAAGASSELDLMEGLSVGKYHLHPSLAVEVIRAARVGDGAAREVIHWAGEELGWLVVAVARQIGMAGDDLEIVQSGSVFLAGDLISIPMRQVVLQHCAKARLMRLDGPPVVGAVLLGMEQAGINGYSVRAHITKTAIGLLS